MPCERMQERTDDKARTVEVVGTTTVLPIATPCDQAHEQGSPASGDIGNEGWANQPTN